MSPTRHRQRGEKCAAERVTLDAISTYCSDVLSASPQLLSLKADEYCRATALFYLSAFITFAAARDESVNGHDNVTAAACARRAGGDAYSCAIADENRRGRQPCYERIAALIAASRLIDENVKRERLRELRRSSIIIGRFRVRLSYRYRRGRAVTLAHFYLSPSSP